MTDREEADIAREKSKIDAISDIMAEYFDDSILFRDVMNQVDDTVIPFIRNHVALMIENAYHRGALAAIDEIKRYREELDKEYSDNEGKVSD
jgi:GTP1/Obg family GTP-binding protein